MPQTPYINLWVATDDDGTQWLFDTKPIRYASIWISSKTKKKLNPLIRLPKKEYFESLSWEDDPIKVQLVVA